jgi:hypothetical protein
MRRRKSRRQRLEQAIERAIDLLDELDGDPESEPSLGSSSCVGPLEGWIDIDGRWSQEFWASGSRDDLEDEHDGREHDQKSWSNPLAENRVEEERTLR